MEILFCSSYCSYIYNCCERRPAKIANMEAIASVPNSSAISIALHGTFDEDTSIKTIDLSGDTTTSGANVVDTKLTDANYTIKGSLGADSIRGGQGDDSIVLTDDTKIDTVVFVDTNGTDTITGFTVNEDLLDFTELTGISGVTVAQWMKPQMLPQQTFLMEKSSSTPMELTVQATKLLLTTQI